MPEEELIKILFIAFVCVIVVILVTMLFIYLNNRRYRNSKDYNKQIDEAIDRWKSSKTEQSSDEDVSNEKYYKLKSSLISECERKYYLAIRSVLPEEYILQPQVNLATIIEKESNERYQNELYRNVDFCIFNQNFTPIMLIEINDKTHELDKARQARDFKVKEICEAAGIPLIRFWTKYGVNTDYIKMRIFENLKITSSVSE